MRSLTVVLSWQSHDAGLLGTRFSFNETELRCIGLDGRVRRGAAAVRSLLACQ